MKRKLLVLLFSLASLALVACGGGNETSSTGSPVVAQATIAQTVEACTASATYGGTGPLLTATTAPTLFQCATALPNIATGNPWSPTANGGCLNSSSTTGGDGPPLTPTQQIACQNAINNIYDYDSCTALGGSWSYCRVILAN